MYWTPLCCLCFCKDINLEAIKYLIEHGADVNESVKTDDNRIFTPLCCLCVRKDDNLDDIKLLIDLGADINKGTITLLDILCNQENVNIDAIKLLIESVQTLLKNVKQRKNDIQ